MKCLSWVTSLALKNKPDFFVPQVQHVLLHTCLTALVPLVLSAKGENCYVCTHLGLFMSWMTRPEEVQLILLFSFFNTFLSTKPQTEIRILWKQWLVFLYDKTRTWHSVSYFVFWASCKCSSLLCVVYCICLPNPLSFALW